MRRKIVVSSDDDEPIKRVPVNDEEDEDAPLLVQKQTVRITTHARTGPPTGPNLLETEQVGAPTKVQAAEVRDAADPTVPDDPMVDDQMVDDQMVDERMVEEKGVRRPSVEDQAASDSEEDTPLVQAGRKPRGLSRPDVNMSDSDDDDFLMPTKAAPIAQKRAPPSRPSVSLESLKVRTSSTGSTAGSRAAARQKGGASPKTSAKRKASTTKSSTTKASTTKASTTKASTTKASATKTTAAKTATTKTEKAKTEKAMESGAEDSLEDEEEEVCVFKEGQVKACPPMGDAQRAFYESLLAENPRSIIAIKYCVEQGVLMGTQAKETLRKYYALKDVGAFRPINLGGLKPQFASVFES
ncbi:hypothetical protein GNI_024630 [Gregarina niphandrodes]|uniref:Uncharacterized protein n=1 Tax=Gregarina niphandrodes TaxID=110365 RepID=A0A023BBF5_GRENI|nr:hypothetical protein GNI_024630 [Gregarina niphandrodes]EZG79712.1 hypothetical protein GNI_024630 [Gregarina niphandrodes]|eukprot:XP_011134394.1 hypothetical protein GNI_024630 [Gregarina niphandrodes]